jgi:hypothetical protein
MIKSYLDLKSFFVKTRNPQHRFRVPLLYLGDNAVHQPSRRRPGTETKKRIFPVGLDVIVKCFFDFPFIFFSWITGIKIRPEDTGKVERVLLFIAFILLCFGCWKALTALDCNKLIHQLLFSKNESLMMIKNFV